MKMVYIPLCAGFLLGACQFSEPAPVKRSVPSASASEPATSIKYSLPPLPSPSGDPNATPYPVPSTNVTFPPELLQSPTPLPTPSPILESPRVSSPPFIFATPPPPPFQSPSPAPLVLNASTLQKPDIHIISGTITNKGFPLRVSIGIKVKRGDGINFDTYGFVSPDGKFKFSIPLFEDKRVHISIGNYPLYETDLDVNTTNYSFNLALFYAQDQPDECCGEAGGIPKDGYLYGRVRDSAGNPITGAQLKAELAPNISLSDAPRFTESYGGVYRFSKGIYSYVYTDVTATYHNQTQTKRVLTSYAFGSGKNQIDFQFQ